MILHVFCRAYIDIGKTSASSAQSDGRLDLTRFLLSQELKGGLELINQGTWLGKRYVLSLSPLLGSKCRGVNLERIESRTRTSASTVSEVAFRKKGVRCFGR